MEKTRNNSTIPQNVLTSFLAEFSPEEFLIQVFEKSSAGIVIARSNGEILSINEAFTSLFKKPPADSTNNLSAIQISYEKDGQIKSGNLFDQILASQTQNCFVCKMGKVSILCQPTWINNNKLLLLSLHSIDHTIVELRSIELDVSKQKEEEKALKQSKKHIEAVLRENEQRYKQIFQNSLLGIYRSTADGKLLDVNPSFANTMGYDSPKELLGVVKSAQELYVNPSQREALIKIANTSGSVRGYETQMKSKNGDTLWIAINSKKIEDNTIGNYFEGTIEDITERKSWEKLLVESEERYRILFENSSDANLILDKENIVDCNEKFLDLFNYNTFDEVYELSPWDFSPETQPGGVNSKSLSKRMIREAYDKGTKRFEWLHINDDNEEIWFDISLTLITIDGTKKLHVVMRDINDKVLIENELRVYRERLQKIVDERTAELQEKNEELERMNSLFVGREFRIKELRDKVKELESEISKLQR